MYRAPVLVYIAKIKDLTDKLHMKALQFATKLQKLIHANIEPSF